MERETNLIHETKTITEPGELISFDQLESPTPGFIVQITGHLTTKRYKYATVFIDQASNLGYVYMQTKNNTIGTLEAKAHFSNTV